MGFHGVKVGFQGVKTIQVCMYGKVKKQMAIIYGSLFNLLYKNGMLYVEIVCCMYSLELPQHTIS